MHQFIAASGDSQYIELARRFEYPNVLFSFAYADYPESYKYDMARIIIDSGAFTAWTKGKSVDIFAYADFCKRMQDRFGDRARFVNLDMIPGERGVDSTHDDRIAGMDASIKNADYLRSQGIPVMEVYHQDEPPSFLVKLVDRRQPGEVLAISPRNDVSATKRIAWMRAVLKYMVKHMSIPMDALPPCHGLAVSSWSMLTSFPFYSADASTWVVARKFGHYIDRRGVQKDLLNKFPTTRNKSIVALGGIWTIQNLRKMERDVTDYWRARGVTWTD